MKLSSSRQLTRQSAFSTSGFALLVVDGCSRMLAIGAQGFSFRSVSEPESEVVQRGCREGFTEPLRINMTLIRRRIKSPDLVFETITSGYSSNTQMMICYLQNSVSKQILKAIRERLENCNLKMILASGYLSSYLEDNNSKSLFFGCRDFRKTGYGLRKAVGGQSGNSD